MEHGRPVAGCPVEPGRSVPGQIWARDEQLDFEVEEGGDVKFEGFCGWKRVERVGKARSTRGNTNPWINHKSQKMKYIIMDVRINIYFLIRKKVGRQTTILLLNAECKVHICLPLEA